MITGDTPARLLAVTVVGSVDGESFPALVEAAMTDASGREWRFIDKAPIFGVDPAGAEGRPTGGVIRCRIIDPAGGGNRDGVIIVDTAVIDGVESTDGTSRFEVVAEQLLETESAPTSE